MSLKRKKIFQVGVEGMIARVNPNPFGSNYLVGYYYGLSEPMMTLNEEYYVVPTLDLIGIIGGTLGIFVGFSFYGTFKDILDITVNLISKLCLKGKSK